MQDRRRQHERVAEHTERCLGQGHPKGRLQPGVSTALASKLVAHLFLDVANDPVELLA